jgi:hypothetical protein
MVGKAVERRSVARYIIVQKITQNYYFLTTDALLQVTFA